jgi:hypothetical protein
VEEFLHSQSHLAAQTTAQPGWRKRARFLTDAIVARTAEEGELTSSAFRLVEQRGCQDGPLGYYKSTQPKGRAFGGTRRVPQLISIRPG